MTQIESIYFTQNGQQWVTEQWVDDKGVVCSTNTHPVYDANGNPLPAEPTE